MTWVLHLQKGITGVEFVRYKYVLLIALLVMYASNTVKHNIYNLFHLTV